MSVIKDMINNKADELALQSYGKDYFELDRDEKVMIMDLAGYAVDLDIAQEVKADIASVKDTGIMVIEANK